jgi:hypothetical protein
MSDQSSDSSKDPNKKTAKLTPPTPNQTAKLGDLPSVEPSIEPPVRKRRRWPLLIGVAFVLLILFSGAGFATATALENQDSFCISCHTVPETTYYNRAYVALDNPSNASTVTDLVTAHYHLSQSNGKAAFACIECHRGNAGIVDRVAAIALGAKDTAVWVLSAGGDPTIEKPADPNGIWLTDAACISCHTDTLLNVTGFNNHYHTRLPETGQLVASGAQFVVSSDNSGLNQQRVLDNWAKPVDVSLNCSSCHLAHKTMTNGTSTKFIDQQVVLKACQDCHVAAGQGPQDLTTATQ